MNNEKFLDHYIVQKTLGRGRYSKTKAVKSRNSKEQYAAKIFFNSSFAQIAIHEASIMRVLSSRFVVQIIDFSLQGIYYKKDGSEHSCIYILMEICSNSDLFNLSISRNYFSLSLIKFVFLQILSCVEHCHSLGVYHQDLRPQNILFDDEFAVKLCDFGSACSLNLFPCKGIQTCQFTPPEAYRGSQFDGRLADVFALGGILFYLYCQCPAFHTAGITDPLFRLFLNCPEQYWSKFAQKKKVDETFFSPGFKELVHGMMNFDPNKRMTIDEIKQHPWLSFEDFGADQVREEIVSRRNESEILLNSQKEKKKNSKERFRNYRSLDEIDQLSGSLTDTACKQLYPTSLYNKLTQVRSYLNEKLLFNEILKLLQSLQGEIEIKDFFQIKCSLITDIDSLDLKVVLYKMEDLTIVEFKYIRGCYFELFEVINKFRETLSSINEP